MFAQREPPYGEASRPLTAAKTASAVQRSVREICLANRTNEAANRNEMEVEHL